VKIGLQLNRFDYPGGTPAIGPTLARVAREADAAGFDSIWVMDHFFQIRGIGPVEDPMLEGWTTLGYLAAHTRRARLGLMVGGVHYRLPGLWVKAATTLDVLSGGRAWLGIGAAWNQGPLRRRPLHRHAAPQRAAVAEPATRPDHGRRRRRAEDAAPGGPLRRRDERLRRASPPSPGRGRST